MGWQTLTVAMARANLSVFWDLLKGLLGAPNEASARVQEADNKEEEETDILFTHFLLLVKSPQLKRQSRWRLISGPFTVLNHSGCHLTRWGYPSVSWAWWGPLRYNISSNPHPLCGIRAKSYYSCVFPNCGKRIQNWLFMCFHIHHDHL